MSSWRHFDLLLVADVRVKAFLIWLIIFLVSHGLSACLLFARVYRWRVYFKKIEIWKRWLWSPLLASMVSFTSWVINAAMLDFALNSNLSRLCIFKLSILLFTGLVWNILRFIGCLGIRLRGDFTYLQVTLAICSMYYPLISTWWTFPLNVLIWIPVLDLFSMDLWRPSQCWSTFA